jgi:hypothetical protein
VEERVKIYNVPEGVQYGAAGLLATDGLELQERRVWLLLQRCVESTNGHDEARGFHARAWKDIPAEADTIAVLYLAPLLLQSLVVHRVCSPGSNSVTRANVEYEGG